MSSDNGTEPPSPNTEKADAEIGEILDALLLELPEVCTNELVLSECISIIKLSENTIVYFTF